MLRYTVCDLDEYEMYLSKLLDSRGIILSRDTR